MAASPDLCERDCRRSSLLLAGEVRCPASTFICGYRDPALRVPDSDRRPQSQTATGRSAGPSPCRRSSQETGRRCLELILKIGFVSGHGFIRAEKSPRNQRFSPWGARQLSLRIFLKHTLAEALPAL